MYRPIQYFWLFLFMVLMTSCSTARKIEKSSEIMQTNVTQPKFNQLSTKDLVKMVKMPTTPIELLKNLQFALNSEMLLREDFYTEENLRKLTGGTKFGWHSTGKVGANFIDIEVFGLDQIPRYKPYDPASPNFINLRFKGTKQENGKLSISVSTRFEFGDPRVSYSEIEKLFDTQWQALEKPRWSSNRTYREPTEPHGNQKWGYVINRSESVEERVDIDFGPSAIAESIFFKQEQK